MRSYVFLTCLAVFVAQPAGAASSPKLQLEQRLAAMVAENPGEYGIAAMDVATGRTISFNANQQFPMASTMKIV